MTYHSHPPVTRILFLCLLSILFLPVSTHAQTGVAVAFFQTIDVNPRSQALGESTVAMRGYNGAAQFNPATIGVHNTVQVSTTLDLDAGLKTPWLPDALSNLSLISPSIDYKPNRWAFAYTYKRFSLGDREARDAQNRPLGIITVYDESHKVATAFDVNPVLTLGLAVNLVRMVNGGTVGGFDASSTTFSIDLGLYYKRQIKVPYAKVQTSAGWSLLDFGRRFQFESSFSDDVRREALPMMMRGGIGLTIDTEQQFIGLPILSVGLYGSLAKPLAYYDQEALEAVGPFQALFRDGWKPREVRRNSITDDDAVFKILSAWDQTTRHGGIEVALLKIVNFRWGVYRENEFLGNRNYDAFGWGIDLYYVTLDYAKNRNTDGPFDGMQYWKVTARVPLAATRDNFWGAVIDHFSR